MRIAIIGSGYVGLVTGTCLASVGHHVICVDSLPQGVDAINQGKPPFYEPGLEQLLVSTLQTGRLKVTTNVEESVAVSEVTFIAV